MRRSVSLDAAFSPPFELFILSAEPLVVRACGTSTIATIKTLISKKRINFDFRAVLCLENSGSNPVPLGDDVTLESIGLDVAQFPTLMLLPAAEPASPLPERVSWLQSGVPSVPKSSSPHRQPAPVAPLHQTPKTAPGLTRSKTEPREIFSNKALRLQRLLQKAELRAAVQLQLSWRAKQTRLAEAAMEAARREREQVEEVMKREHEHAILITREREQAAAEAMRLREREQVEKAKRERNAREEEAENAELAAAALDLEAATRLERELRVAANVARARVSTAPAPMKDIAVAAAAAAAAAVTVAAARSQHWSGSPPGSPPRAGFSSSSEQAVATSQHDADEGREQGQEQEQEEDDNPLAGIDPSLLRAVQTIQSRWRRAVIRRRAWHRRQSVSRHGSVHQGLAHKQTGYRRFGRWQLVTWGLRFVELAEEAICYQHVRSRRQPIPGGQLASRLSDEASRLPRLKIMRRRPKCIQASGAKKLIPYESIRRVGVQSDDQTVLVLECFERVYFFKMPTTAHCSEWAAALCVAAAQINGNELETSNMAI